MANPHDEDALLAPQTLQLTNAHTPGSVEEYLNSRCLSVDQTKAITETGIVDIFNRTAPQQLRLFLTGKPGTGKSYVVETIIEMAELFGNKHVATSAPFGVATANIFGMTLHLFLTST